MKKISIIPVFIVFFISIACNLSNIQKNAQKEVEQVPTQLLVTDLPQPTIAVLLPTKEPTKEATETPSVEPTIEETETKPTIEPTQTCSLYGIEEFESSSPCWPSDLDDMTSVTSLTNSKDEFAGINNGMLEFKHVVSDEIYLYSFNTQNQYDQVILEANFIKIEPSSNQNGATLVCHVNESGWYEARIESGGTFHIFHYDAAVKAKGGNPYFLIAEGGASALKVGSNVENTIRWSCGEKVLKLSINGKDTWTKEIFDMISGGGVGLGLVSYSGKFPLHIGFNQVKIIKY